MNSNGEYSVKSGYKLLMDQAANDRPGPSYVSLSKHIWNGTRRNRLRAGELAVPLNHINSLAQDSLLEFQVARPLPFSHSSPPSLVKWSPPPMNWMKVNFDEALFKDAGFTGLGVIIRNDLGLAMAASSQLIPLPTSVEMVEVLAARNAICLARELMFDKVIVEGDSELVIKALNSTSYSSSSFGHIIRDIKIVASVLNEVVYCHTRRQGNKVAHKISRLACNFPTSNVWMEEVPLDIAPLYVFELI
nr:hypothetical protein CFP56_61396 [Quercus suber]